MKTNTEPHPFKSWLSRTNRSQTWARDRALELGGALSQSHLSEILTGAGVPSVATLALLEQVSDGRVKATRMLVWHLQRRAA